MGPFDAEESFTTCRGLRSKPELKHHSCTGRHRLASHSFCCCICQSSPSHSKLRKPKGLLLPRANTKTSQIKQIAGHPSNSPRAQHAPLESFLYRHLGLNRHLKSSTGMEKFGCETPVFRNLDRCQQLELPLLQAKLICSYSCLRAERQGKLSLSKHDHVAAFFTRIKMDGRPFQVQR